MSNQIARGVHAQIVWIHEVPQDAFDLLPFKIGSTGSKSHTVKGVEIVFFRIGHGLEPQSAKEQP